MKSLGIPEGYKLKGLLNNGLCQTYLCEDNEGIRHVIKFFPKKSDDEMEYNESLKREIQFISSFNCKYVIKAEIILENPNNFVAIFPYIKGKEFKGSFNFSSENEYAIVMLKVLAALRYLHSQNIVHGDLQPANILITEGTNDPVILDFGFSHTSDTKSQLYTPAYAAPEMKIQDDADVSTTFETDVYALGLLFYIFITKLQSADMIKKNKMFSQDIWSLHKQSLKELLIAMLSPNPTERITVHECLHHNYFEETLGKEIIDEIIKESN